MGLAVLLVAFAPAGAESAAADREGFLLAAGDTLRLDILDDDKEPVDVTVAEDGTIQAPYLGSVEVAGLGITDALSRVTERYVEKGIFVVPKIGLSVLTYRPVFVTGDVRQPGSYPFQPRLTVEKALGLAGGQITAAATEDPILARARIRGELDAVDSTIIREALGIARLRAQLNGRKEIKEEDLPAEARAYVTGPVAETMRAVELQILKNDLDGFAARTKILEQGIVEAERGLVLLQQLSEKISESVAFSQAELDRARKLQKQGIKTLNEVNTLERQRAADEVRQLQVLANMSDDRRALGLLKSQLAELEHTRQQEALVDLQTRNAALAKAIATRRAGEEQIMLMSSLAAQDAAQNREIVINYTIRREIDGTVTNIAATPETAVSPGDVVVVKIAPPENPASVAVLDKAAKPVQ
ncbi:polysaccharide biosynthesis/export family protein [Rhodoligotrophos ferricapiens]|uniref:polysaccharide biosynthesis/export family protein n=1 Tax=Rhodoligotrophos ferricapiens TaxID=3069264 RepID=UPI00315D2287